MDIKNNATEKSEPDMSGRGNDILNTIQLLQNKEIHVGYLKADLHFRYSTTFSYPVIFRLQGTGTVPETVALAFDISQADKTKQLVEEKFIVPKVCAKVSRNSIVNYFVDIVEKNSKFALYLNEKPPAYDKLAFYPLTDSQKIVFNQHLVMAVIKILDERTRIKHTDTL